MESKENESADIIGNLISQDLAAKIGKAIQNYEHLHKNELTFDRVLKSLEANVFGLLIGSYEHKIFNKKQILSLKSASHKRLSERVKQRMKEIDEEAKNGR